MEEKLCSFFSSCLMPRRGLSRSSWHLKCISLAKDLHQVLKPKNIGTWGATDIAERHVKYQSFHHCLSRFFTSDDDLQCALYSTLCSGRFQRTICESGRKVGMTPYRTMCMISCAGAQRPGWNCEWVPSACSALKSSVRIS